MRNELGVKIVYMSVICMLIALMGCGSSNDKGNDVNEVDSAIYKEQKDTLDSQQLIVVSTSGWDKVTGKFYCYEKISGQWMLKFSDQVVVGIKGMGIGLGIKSFEFPDAPVKKEGDLKAPAGIFKISNAFGYASKSEVTWLKVPYLEATSALLCIDDGSSSSYNKLVNTDETTKDWNSSEDMRRKDNLYKWGLFVEHNSVNPTQGKGSCIFIHIWKNNSSGTAGCSAMAEDNILKLLKWIDSSKNPLLVQFPETEYLKVSEVTDLPKL